MSTPNKPSLGTKTKNICLTLNGTDMSGKPRTVVVLGVERGGTSMVGGILRALGISMGKRAGLNHEDPLFLIEEHDKLQRRIRTRNKEEDVWGFKVPKASLHLPFYEDNLRNPLYVVVYRNSLSIVDSWIQRGAGTSVDVLDRIATYHGAILDFLKVTKSPVLLLNYERSVADDAAKQQVVEELARFIGIELTEDLHARATGMMTGDGKGYVNLPEHFFQITPGAPEGARPALELAEVAPENRDADGWVTHEKVRPQLMFKRADGENLPKAFWLEVDLEAEGLDLAGDPMRFYFNFTGEYFPGHCTRPRMEMGTNRYWVETSGNASDLAFGPLNLPSKLRMGVRMAEATEADIAAAHAAHEAEAPEVQGGAEVAGKKSLLEKAMDKVMKS